MNMIIMTIITIFNINIVTPGEVESWAISALSRLRDLAEDEEMWNRTLGTTSDFFEIPTEEESGLLCAYTYFHMIYVIEWYYDYIGYDYYHPDFNFYYYDDHIYHQHEDDYSSSGLGEYYLGSESGGKLQGGKYDFFILLFRIWSER